MAELTIDVGTDEETKQRIIDAAAQQLLWRYTEDPEDGSTVEVPKELQRRLEEKITETIRDEARAAAPKVAESILAEGVQQTTQYGSPRGDRKAIRDIVAEEVVAQLTRKDRSHGLTGGETVIEQMLKKEVARQVRDELQGTLDEAKKVIADAAGAEATKALSDALRKALPGVKV